jgi:hypothetical protein
LRQSSNDRGMGRIWAAPMLIPAVALGDASASE